MHERQPEREQQPIEMIEVIEARYEQPLDHHAEAPTMIGASTSAPQ